MPASPLAVQMVQPHLEERKNHCYIPDTTIGRILRYDNDIPKVQSWSMLLMMRSHSWSRVREPHSPSRGLYNKAFCSSSVRGTLRPNSSGNAAADRWRKWDGGKQETDNHNLLFKQCQLDIWTVDTLNLMVAMVETTMFVCVCVRVRFCLMSPQGQ